MLKNAKVAGQDASTQFDSFHNASVLEKYAHLKIGTLKSTADETNETNDDDALDGPFGEGVPFGDPYWYQVIFYQGSIQQKVIQFALLSRVTS